MYMKHYAPNRCLYIKVAKLRTGVGRVQNIFKEHWGGGGGGGVPGGGGGVRLDVNEEFKFLGKFTKKNNSGVGGVGGGMGEGGYGGMWGMKDVNEE